MARRRFRHGGKQRGFAGGSVTMVAEPSATVETINPQSDTSTELSANSSEDGLKPTTEIEQNQAASDPDKSDTAQQLKESVPTPQPESAVNPAVKTGKGFTVQVASVQSSQAANQMLKRLTSLGYAAYTVQSKVNDTPWYRLRIGYYEQRGDARDIMTRLRADHYDPFLIQF